VLGEIQVPVVRSPTQRSPCASGLRFTLPAAAVREGLEAAAGPGCHRVGGTAVGGTGAGSGMVGRGLGWLNRSIIHQVD